MQVTSLPYSGFEPTDRQPADGSFETNSPAKEPQVLHSDDTISLLQDRIRFLEGHIVELQGEKNELRRKNKTHQLRIKILRESDSNKDSIFIQKAPNSIGKHLGILG